jgi:hypothetical protein
MLHSRSAASPQLDLELDVDVPRESGQRWDTRSAITASRPVPGVGKSLSFISGVLLIAFCRLITLGSTLHRSESHSGSFLK